MQGAIVKVALCHHFFLVNELFTAAVNSYSLNALDTTADLISVNPLYSTHAGNGLIKGKAMPVSKIVI